MRIPKKKKQQADFVALVLLICIIFTCAGCAFFRVFSDDSSAIAVVNGYEIPVDAFRKRIGDIHRAKSMAPSTGEAGEIDIEEIIEEIVNDRLIVQEAYSVGLDKSPVFTDRVIKYITNRSVLRLRKEEVTDKIDVTDDELRAYYDTHYEEISVLQIFTKDRNTAEEALMLLRDGMDFFEAAKSKSVWKGKEGGDLGFIKRGRMEKAFDEAAFVLKEGETSDIVKTHAGFHIIKMVERRPAPDENFDGLKKKLRKKLLREKEKKRSDAYVAELKNKADVSIDTELLQSLDAHAEECDEDTVVASVNGKSITACEVVREAKQKQSRRMTSHEGQELQNMNQKIVDGLILFALVEEEAVKRNYVDDPSFAADVEQYKDNFLITLYRQEIILPRAIPTEEELRQYYEAHKDDFRKDYEVWFSKMTFSDPDAAAEALSELNKGADFEFLASRKAFGRPGAGANVWVPLGRLSPEIRKSIRNLEPGGISDVIGDERKYSIVKLKGKRGGEPEEFSDVSDKVNQAAAKEKFDEWQREYLKELRKASVIRINRKQINELMKKRGKETSREQVGLSD